MSNVFRKIRLVLADTVLRRRILMTVLLLGVFRLLANIPIAGVDKLQLEQFLGQGQLFGFLDLFAGGGLSSLSIIMLGVSPYITASIIFQLLTAVSPKIKQMHTEEGDAGRMRFAQYSRILTVPLALLQAIGLLSYLAKQGVLLPMGGFGFVTAILVVTAGSLLLMWLGELITEYGIGNGVSLIIFAGIVSQLPSAVGGFLAGGYNPQDLPVYVAFIVLALVTIAGVVYITEAERPIQITYARQAPGTVGATNYLPLRLNQAGVMPIIFAISIILFPQLIAEYVSKVATGNLAEIASWVSVNLADPWVHGVLYFVLVFIFTYFYTAITFDPKAMSEHLQRSGAFISGIRPGESTSHYVSHVMTKITLVGALFLGIIAILPSIMQGLTHRPELALGGTSLLIVVSVVIDLVRRMDAQISMREY